MSNEFDSLPEAPDTSIAAPTGAPSEFDNLPEAPDAPAPTTPAPTPSSWRERIGAKLRSPGPNLPNDADAGEGALALAETALSGVTGGFGSLADALTGSDPGTHDWAYRARTDPGQDMAQGLGAVGNAVGTKYDQAVGTGPLAQTIKERAPEALGAISTAVPVVKAMPGALGAATSVAKAMPGALRWASGADTPAAVVADPSVAADSLGAARTTPDISGLSPETQSVLAKTPNPNLDVLARHIDAETLPLPEGVDPLRLTKGQATADPQQFSVEKNLRGHPDTQGLLTDSITSNDQKLGLSLGEIQAQATPDIVQRSNLEHGQAAVDAVKEWLNASAVNVRAKYQALADENGGQLPINKGAALGQIQDKLAESPGLPETAQQNSVVRGVMGALASDKPMTFSQFENARTNLAGVQRGGGSDAAAAGVVRGALEDMPLALPDAQTISAPAAPNFMSSVERMKALADNARSAARTQFKTIEANPALDAVANDNTPRSSDGLHIVGTPSPLADTFMNAFATGNGATASKAFVSRLQGLMSDKPEFGNAVEAASLNNLKTAAGIDPYGNLPTTGFRAASFRNARNAMQPKADVLMSPDSAAATAQLSRVAGYLNDAPKGHTVNSSNSGIVADTLKNFGAPTPAPAAAPSSAAGVIAGHAVNHAVNLGAAHTGLFGMAVKDMGRAILKGKRDTQAAAAAKQAAAATSGARLKFAQEATAPGAGLDYQSAPATSSPQGYASGGAVEPLVQRLMSNAKRAKKATDATSKPLLGVPDEAIVKALDVAQQAI